MYLIIHIFFYALSCIISCQNVYYNKNKRLDMRKSQKIKELSMVKDILFTWYYTGDDMLTDEWNLEFKNPRVTPLDNKVNDVVTIGKYSDSSNMWSINHGSSLMFLFDCDRKFRKLERAKAYVETELKHFFFVANWYFDTK